VIFSAPLQNVCGANPVLCSTSTGIFPGVNQTGSDFYHLPSLSTEVKGRVEL
jgi:hypothetical protein